jgi:cell division protein ZapA (FtsZ GTPase activity inhibitor)
MSENDLKTIKITIAGREFPVKVTPEEELDVLQLGVDINKQVSDFQAAYPGRDKLDYVIMAMLSYTYDLKKSAHTADVERVNQKVEAIEELLSE